MTPAYDCWKSKIKIKHIKNEKIKQVLSEIHELSSRETTFEKSVGLRDFGASTLRHLETLTWKSININCFFNYSNFPLENSPENESRVIWILYLAITY